MRMFLATRGRAKNFIFRLKLFTNILRHFEWDTQNVVPEFLFVSIAISMRVLMLLFVFLVASPYVEDIEFDAITLHNIYIRTF